MIAIGISLLNDKRRARKGLHEPDYQDWDDDEASPLDTTPSDISASDISASDISASDLTASDITTDDLPHPDDRR